MNYTTRILLLIGLFLATISFANPAAATVFQMDSFTVNKNGTVIFNDEFDDGNAPPSAPNYQNGNTARYIVRGDLGTETSADGGRLQIDTDRGELIASSISGDELLFQRARLMTNIDPNSNRGLKAHHNISVRGTFDMIEPDARQNFGIRLVDWAGQNPANDIVEISLRKNQRGESSVRFAQLDTTNGDVDLLGSYGLADSSFDIYDQIAFELFTGAENNTVLASFWLFDDDGVADDINFTFSATGDIFDGENWTRAEFFARDHSLGQAPAPAPVPEPATMLLLGTGLAGMVGIRRKKLKKN